MARHTYSSLINLPTGTILYVFNYYLQTNFNLKATAIKKIKISNNNGRIELNNILINGSTGAYINRYAYSYMFETYEEALDCRKQLNIEVMDRIQNKIIELDTLYLKLSNE